MSAMTRSDRLALLEDLVCPVCGERQVSYEELLACLFDHDDDGIEIACDYISEARELMLDEEAEDILEYEYED